MTLPYPPGPQVERFDHVSLAVWDIAAAAPIIDLLGGTYVDGGDATAAGFRWAQWRLPAAGKLEVIQPLDPDDADHFLVRFLRDRGEGLHHLTFKVGDIEEAVRRAEDLGFDVVGRSDGDGWKEAFIHPASARGMLIQLAEWPEASPPA